MRKLREVMSYPGLWLFLASAAYVFARGDASRSLLGLLAATSLGVGELIVSGQTLAQGGTPQSVLPRFLMGIGALALAAADVLDRVPVAWGGSLVLATGLILWARQLQARAQQSESL
jgi:hypothetical protein